MTTPPYRLEEICTFIKGTYPIMKTEPGEYPLVVTASFRRTASSYQIEGRAVCIPLISSTGHGDAALHRVHYQEGRFALANLLVALLPKTPAAYCPKYLYYLLNAKRNSLFVPLMQGTANVSLKIGDIAGVEVSLPSLAEQRRIVARIEEFAARIGEAARLREFARIETGMLGGAATAGLLRTLGPKPKKRLGDVVSLRGGGTPDKSNPLFWSGSIPWISPKDMKGRRLRDGADHISKDATRASPAKLLPIGSVLVVVRGMILVHTVPVALLEAPATINQDIKALIPRPEVAGDYLTAVLWALNHQLLELVEKSTHDTRKLQTDALLHFEIPVPSLRDQQRIVARLDDLQAKVDALKALQERTAAELDALLPSILDKAFRGEL